MGWTKLNSDGSSEGSTGKAGAGGVLRNHLGGWIKGFGHYLGNTNSLMAKCWALRDGLLLAKESGIQSLLVELDAQVVVDLFLGNTSDNCY